MALFHSKHSAAAYGQDSVDSEYDETMSNDWADEEAVCDEEVKKITGEEEEDDVKPTLGVFSSQESDNLLSELSQNSHTNLLTLAEVTDSTQLLGNVTANTRHNDLPLGVTSSSRDSSSRMLEYSHSPRLANSQPGIDNSSFVFGEISNDSNDRESAIGTSSSRLESQSTQSDIELVTESQSFLTPTSTANISKSPRTHGNSGGLLGNMTLSHYSPNVPDELHFILPSPLSPQQHLSTLPLRRHSCVSSASSSHEQLSDSATNSGYQGDELV